MASDIRPSSSQGSPFDPLSSETFSDSYEKVNKLVKLFESLEFAETSPLLTFNDKTQQFEPRRSISWSSMRGAGFEQFTKGLDIGTDLADKLHQHAAALYFSEIAIEGADRASLEEIINENGEFLKNKLQQLMMITEKARERINTIAQHYQSIDKSEKAQELLDKSKKIFDNLEESMQFFHIQKSPELEDIESLSESSEIDDFTELLPGTFGHDLVSQAPRYRATLLEVRSNPESGVIIPQQLVKDSVGGVFYKSETNKAEVRTACNNLQPYKSTPPLTTRPEAPWISLAFIDAKVTPDAINPTSLRDEHHPENNDLHNFKYQINPNGQICITCGVIDTERKAEEFIEGLIFILEERKKNSTEAKPLRIVLQQLNSFNPDSKLLKKQHEMSRFIESELRKKEPYLKLLNVSPFQDAVPIISHLNHSLNVASTFPGENAQSHTQNLDGVTTLALWFAEDLQELSQKGEDISEAQAFILACQKVGRLSEEIKKIKNKISMNEKQVIDKIPEIDDYESSSARISEDEEYSEPISESILSQKEKAARQIVEKSATFSTSLSQNASDTATLQKELVRLQAKLTTQLQKIVKLSSEPEVVFPDKTHHTIERLKLSLLERLKLSLLNSFLSVQTGLSSLSQITQLELQFLLYMVQDVTVEMNCKSGLDRTGLARALWDGLNILYEELIQEVPTKEIAYSTLFSLIQEQDALSIELNDIQQSVAYKNIDGVANTLQLVDNKRALPFRQMVLNAIHRRYPTNPDKLNKLKMALHYQDLVTHQFFSTAQIVTLESTGAVGLKYGHDTKAGAISGNPHPLKRISMFIQTEDGKTIQLYDYMRSLISDEDLIRGIGQKKRFFTQAGLDLILRNSQLRGA